jgi:hypothetical protein
MFGTAALFQCIMPSVPIENFRVAAACQMDDGRREGDSPAWFS